MKDKSDFEIMFCENLIRANPNFVPALSYLGDVYTKMGLYEKGLVMDKRLVSLKPEDPIAHYNLACSFSLLGNIEEASKHLCKAVLFGYSDLSYILEDKDLANLRRDARFNDTFRKLKQVLAER